MGQNLAVFSQRFSLLGIAKGNFQSTPWRDYTLLKIHVLSPDHYFSSDLIVAKKATLRYNTLHGYTL